MEASRCWRTTHLRNLPPLSHLPNVGGSGHTDSLHHDSKVDMGVQVDFTEDEDKEPQLSEQNVQVGVEAVTSDTNQCLDALDAISMGDTETVGIDTES